MRTAASSLACLLLLTLSLFHTSALHAQPGGPAAQPLTPVEQGVELTSLSPESAQAPADPAAESAQAPAAALDGAALDAAGDERWDSRFAMPGLQGDVSAAAVAPDGTLYAVVGDNEVWRWDGKSWRNLGEADSSIYGMAYAGGRLYVAGWFDERIGAFPVRYLASWNGAAWEQVGDGTGPTSIVCGDCDPNVGTIYSLAGVGDTLYIGGSFNALDGVSANGIATWDGERFAALGEGIRGKDFNGDPDETDNTKVYTIVAAGGKLYVGGEFDYAGSTLANSIAVWDGNAWAGLAGGVIYNNFGDPSAGKVNAIAVDGATVYAGGQFDRAGGKPAASVARFANGAWAALGAGATADFMGEKNVSALAIEGGALLMGGEFDFAGGQEAAGLARYANGAWSAVGGLQRFDSVYLILSIPGGGQYIGGSFDDIGGVNANRIVRRSGASWKALGEGTTFSATGNFGEGNVNAIVADDAGSVYVGGRFATAGGVLVNHVARWDGARWHALGAGVADGRFSTEVNALALAGETLYVGGDFLSAGGQSISYVARYNTRTGAWSPLGTGVNGTVNALDYANGTLFVGGDFDRAGNLDVYDVAFWNGAAWGAPSDSTRIYKVFDTCNEAGTQVYAITVSGSYMIVGGNFNAVLVNPNNPCSAASYRLANNLLLYDLASDEWFFLGDNGQYGAGGGPALNPTVEALQVVGPSIEEGGELFVGGDFAQAGDVNAQNIAVWSLANNWLAVGNTSGDSGGVFPDRGVEAMELVGDTLYVGGNFTTAGSATAASVARLNLNTNTWSALGSGVAEKRTVRAMAAAADGLYIGGTFTAVGGVPAAGFTRYTSAGGRDIVGIGGGSVAAEGIAAVFPSGAVPADTTVTLTPLFKAPHVAPAGQIAVRSLRLSATRGGQAVSSFSKAYTLKITYTPAMLEAMGVRSASSLKIVRWDGQKWVALSGAKVDTAARAVTVSTSAGGEFALIGSRAGATPGEFTLYMPSLIR